MYNMPEKQPATETIKKVWNELPVSMKVQVIKAMKCWKSNCSVAQESGCGRTQISKIIQQKETIMRSLMDGVNTDMKYFIPQNMLAPI